MNLVYADKPRCHCAVFGVCGTPHASRLACEGLMALQHRGQEASGIVSAWRDPATGSVRFRSHRDLGLVSDVYREERILNELLAGEAAIGHNRYSTAGASGNKANIQPFSVIYKGGNLAIAHNGNLTNFRGLRTRLQEEGTIFQTTSDTEVILHLIARSSSPSRIGQIRDALRQVRGAYSLVILTDEALVAARDPRGFRPLAIGKKGNAWFVASETCGFDIVDVECVRDVAPGEMVVFDYAAGPDAGPASLRIQDAPPPPPRFCIFEYIYFSRPDSRVFGHSVDKVRRKLGKNLARARPVHPAAPGEKQIVISVPDSSNTATMGFVQQTVKDGGLARLEIGLIRSHYVGRTFIQPRQQVRANDVKTKFNTVRGVLQDRVVVIVDDSIVRGTTSRQLVQLIRQAGPKEVHFRVTSPPIRYPCHYGMDFPTSGELIANMHDGNPEAIARSIGADTLEYLPMEDLLSAMPTESGEQYCTACFDGHYPVEVEENRLKEEHEA
ncbi:MAG: amidophosphoribosyltransferase [Bacteroidota bacterium]